MVSKSLITEAIAKSSRQLRLGRSFLIDSLVWDHKSGRAGEENFLPSYLVHPITGSEEKGAYVFVMKFEVLRRSNTVMGVWYIDQTHFPTYRSLELISIYQ